MRVSVDAILAVAASLLLLAPQPLLPTAGADHPVHVPHAPLLFTSNAHFGNSALCVPNAAMGVVGGCGTLSNPWRIEGWHFLGSPVASGTLIPVKFIGTTDHVRVTDNLFSLGGAISIESSRNIAIDANVFSQTTALLLSDSAATPSTNIRFTGNQVVSVFNGVWIDGYSLNKANQIQITDNTFAGSTTAAIELTDVTDVTITGNTITGNKDGLSCPFGGCGGVTISDNDISSNTGVGIKGDWNGRVLSNRIEDNTYGIQGSICSFSPGLQNNNIAGNAVYGLRLLNCNLDATNNWWGDASGPSGIGPGSGDAIQLGAGADGIDYDPWLTAPNPNAGS